MTVSANNYATPSKGTAEATGSFATHSKGKGPFSAFGQVQAGTAAIVYQALTQLWKAINSIVQQCQEQASLQAQMQQSAAEGNADSIISAANDQKNQLISQAAGSFASAATSLGCAIVEGVQSNTAFNEQNTWNTNAENLTNLSNELINTPPSQTMAAGQSAGSNVDSDVSNLLNSGAGELTKIAGGNLDDFKTNAGNMSSDQQAQLAENINTAQNQASQRANSAATRSSQMTTKINMYQQMLQGVPNGGSQVAQGIYQGRAGQNQADAAIDSMVQQQMSQAYQNTVQGISQAGTIANSFISLLAQASSGGGGVQG